MNMKKKLKSLLLLTGVLFIFLNGCRKSDGLVSARAKASDVNAMAADASASANNKPMPIVITATYTSGKFPLFSGTFVTTDGSIPSGTTTMYVQPIGKLVFHCIITLITRNGNISIREECQFATTPSGGQWQIIEGTGDYVNLRGNGNVMMPPGQEVLEGSIRWNP